MAANCADVAGTKEDLTRHVERFRSLAGVQAEGIQRRTRSQRLTSV